MSSPLVIIRGFGGSIITRGFGSGSVVYAIIKSLHLVSEIITSMAHSSLVSFTTKYWFSAMSSIPSKVGISEISTQLQVSSTINRTLNFVSYVELL